MADAPNAAPRKRWSISRAHLERWDVLAYTLLVALGVPLMNYLVSGLVLKLGIAAIFFALAHAYWAIEMQQLIGPVIKNKVVDEERANEQVTSTQLLRNWAAQGALVIWIIVEAIYITWYLAQHQGSSDAATFIVWSLFGPGSPAAMGPVEWFIIVHTFLVGRATFYFFNILLLVLSKAFPRGERIEDERVTINR